jgi:hypothetical protein
MSLGFHYFFTPEGKCIQGDTPIIDYFKVYRGELFQVILELLRRLGV